MSVGVIHQFVFFGRPQLSKFSANKSPFRLQRTKLGFHSKWITLESPPKAVSASSSSVTGSGAEYSEQLLGAKPKGKRQKIAGIDQDELLDPAVLADPDSYFCEFKGVQIHHKVCDVESPRDSLFQDQTNSESPYQTKKIGLPMILLHGFGASVFSWGRVMKPLAQVTGSKVLAFDRPAFGLTSRVNSFEHSSHVRDDKKPLNPYSMIFSVLATLYFIGFLAAEKAVLVGHSAGSLVAVETYFEAPERVAALILVAPAILAPLTVRKIAKGNQSGGESEIQEESSNSNTYGNPFVTLLKFFSKFSKYVAQAIMRLVKGMVVMLNSLYKKALSAFLRSTIAVTLVMNSSLDESVIL